MISVVIFGLGFFFSNKHEFATLFFGGAFTLPQGRKEAPNIILCCMQSAWYVKMEFETHTHTRKFVLGLQIHYDLVHYIFCTCVYGLGDGAT